MDERLVFISDIYCTVLHCILYSRWPFYQHYQNNCLFACTEKQFLITHKLIVSPPWTTTISVWTPLCEYLPNLVMVELEDTPHKLWMFKNGLYHLVRSYDNRAPPDPDISFHLDHQSVGTLKRVFVSESQYIVCCDTKSWFQKRKWLWTAQERGSENGCVPAEARLFALTLPLG